MLAMCRDDVIALLPLFLHSRRAWTGFRVRVEPPPLAGDEARADELLVRALLDNPGDDGP